MNPITDTSSTAGWSYTQSKDSKVYTSSEKKGCAFKRRMWKRERVRTGPPVLPDIEVRIKLYDDILYQLQLSKFNKFKTLFM
jgi:hypothetical protein